MKKIYLTTLALSLFCALGFSQNNSVTLGRAEIPLNLNNYGTFTISTWVKPGSNSSWSPIYNNDNGGFDIALHAYEGEWVIFHNRYVPTNITYVENRWYHTATVFSPTSTKFYIDGQLVYSGIGSSTKNGDPTIGIGYRFTNTNYNFNGEIDELRFWDYERSQQQIDTSRYQELNGSEAGLLAYFSFNSDNFNDESGNGNNGTNLNGLVYDTSSIYLAPSQPVGYTCNTVLNFDGSNDYVQLANPLSIGNNSNTVELRVKIPLAGTQGLGTTERVGNILGNYNSSPNSNWEIHDDGQLRIYWNGGQINSYGTTDLRDNQWHHIAFVRNTSNNTFKAYIDGALEMSLTTAGTNINFSTAHRIGGDIRSTSGGPSFHGAMDELRIWNSAKTQSEISTLSMIELTGTESNLVSYYNFNEAAGTNLTDITGSNNGTLTNMNVSDWVSLPCDTNVSDTTITDTCNTVLNFDGSNDYVQLTTPLIIGNSSNTVEVKVKIPLAGTEGLGATERVGVVLGNYNGSPNSNWEVHDDGQLRIFWNGGQINSYGTIDLRDNEWHHIAFVRNTADNTFKAYVDGVLDINHSTAGTGITFGSTHRIGGDNRSADGGPNFHGAMDEFRIWNVAKTQSELNILSSTTLAGTELGLVHYYNFDEGEGTNLNDLAGTNNGVLTYMSSTSDWTLANGNASCNAASSRMKNPEIATDEMEQEENQISVYPNPTRGNFTLDFGNVTEMSIVTITDYTGKLISSNSYSELQKVTLELNQSAGIYLVRVETNGKIQTKKIIKQ